MPVCADPSTITVHPRGRGEHSRSTNTPPAGRGSSPRARGTLYTRTSRAVCDRFIPAGAGNTFTRVESFLRLVVHPRGRGEHPILRTTIGSIGGSSPRARGTRRPIGRDRNSCGFIPAGAGNTTRPRPFHTAFEVHPRGRGEHRCRRATHARRRGSSPRARGTRHDQSNRLGCRRFIPAGAGNTGN